MNIKIAMLVPVLALWAGGNANADNWIEEWGHLSEDYTIQQAEHTIIITGPGTYKFQATDGAALGDIDEITVQSGVTGEVIIYIEAESDDDSPGAANIRRCNLSGSANTTIAELRITEDLGADGATVASELGSALVARDVLSAIQLDYLDGDIADISG